MAVTPLTLDLRSQLDALYLRQRWETFYHHFPLIFAISESTGALEFRDDTGALYIQGTDEIYIPGDHPEAKSASQILIMPRPPEDSTWNFGLYDVNYIYDLKETVQIKNFRDNVKRFVRDHPQTGSTSSQDGTNIALQIIGEWYHKSKRKEFTDFGYTEWLARNYPLFKDLHPTFVWVDGKAVGFSLWGKLSPNTGIHLIAKDSGMPYLQDYLRMDTYRQMIANGLLYCNDGSDCGIEGLRIYKLKLRPKWIVPIWSWMKA